MTQASRKTEPFTASWQAGVLVAVLLLGLGSARTWYDIVRPAVDVHIAKQWVEVPVRSSKGSVNPFHGMTHASFEYAYVYQGYEYQGSRYAFRHPSLYLDDVRLYAFQHELPKTCFVDPTDARRSVMVRELPRSAYRLEGPLFGMAGLLLMLWAVTFRKIATAGRLSRAATLAPMLLTRGAALFIVGWFIHVIHLRGPSVGSFATLAAALLWAAGLWFSRPWALRTVAGIMIVMAVVLSLCGLNPLGMMDVTTDEVHDPGHVINFLLGWLLGSSTLIAAAYLAVVRSRLVSQDDGQVNPEETLGS